MSNARSQVASQRVADELARKILSGELRPGAAIKQDELAAELGTSRIPVRDALRMLESRGLVSMQANRSARVASLTFKDMDLSYRIREQLEPMLLAESIPHLTDEDIDRIGAIKARLDAVDQIESYMQHSREFHWACFSRADAPLLTQIVERLWDQTLQYRMLYAQVTFDHEETHAIMCAERDLLFGAIRRREVILAPDLLATHIRRTHLYLRNLAHLHDSLGEPD